jgi:hypothetical protein
MSRNDLCACGSGKRFKHCHGAVAPARAARFDALAAHRAGALGSAESLYRRALEENPQDVDALHMLGVVQYERMRYGDALQTLWQAAERTGWSNAVIRHNLGLVLGKLMAADANARQIALLEAYVARERGRNVAGHMAAKVSVVLRVGDDAPFATRAIRSVAAQTWPDIELIVVDDSSGDGPPATAADALAGLPFPSRLVRRERRGAGVAAAFNEGAGWASGRYLALLEGSDCFAPERIEILVNEIIQRGGRWGFSRVMPAPGEAGEGADSDVDPQAAMPRSRSFLGAKPNSFTFMEHNAAVADANLFVERELFVELGGFVDLPQQPGWDFCVRASERTEPVVVDRPLYLQHVDTQQTSAESIRRAHDDDQRLAAGFLARTLDGSEAGGNALGPHHPANRNLLLRTVFRAGHGEFVPVPVMQALAATWRVAAAPRNAAHAAPQSARSRKVALVVLGMHRSGTSAMSRVLNLCGAFLPDKVMPPKLGVNPKGFWEPEAVIDLDARMLGHLGGDWNNVAFTLPHEGELVDDFIADAHALLDHEYEERDVILMKDPRISVLAPLWQRALTSAGYRPAYVVAIRHPLEVARSLHARGDMSVAEGLVLWLAYMKRIDAFAASRDDVVHVRYTDLLDDWRGVVERVAAHADVSLAAGDHAAEVDAFLERDLRNQAAGDDALDTIDFPIDASVVDEIRAVYGRALDRCDRDAAIARSEAADAIGTELVGAIGPAPSLATASFVLCIENNAIRNQALLLCESIRRYAGRHRDAPITAYAPRAGLGVDRETRAQLADLRVEYIDEPLNAHCREYGSANRVVAGAHAERHGDSDFIIVLDSDTVWLDEPALPLDADAALRAVDEKGSATSGPDDYFEAYWQGLAALAGISLGRLPWLVTTIGNERIRASYNGGLIVVRRAAGILVRCADLFAESVRAGLRPYRGTGIDIVASTGSVGAAGSEFWGSNQAALALAAWSITSRVRLYADRYNVPLHMLTEHGEIDPRWRAAPPVHVHYHGMFDARRHEVALDLLERLGVAEDRRQWLAARVPLETYGVAGANAARRQSAAG